MEYHQPYGEADPNAPYKDRNTGAGEPGSRVPAAAVEHPMREIMAVITGAGLTPDRADLTQLLQAIDLRIAELTGEGETESYVTMPAARARLPIFPEIISADGTFNLSAPATGTVRIPAGIEIIHRGIFSVTTAQQDFAMAANKVYHLRWSPTGGFALKDLADNAYNPSALTEGAAAFDTTLDDMLSHRVTTNASNIATFTKLANKHRLVAQGNKIIDPGDTIWQAVNTLDGITSYKIEALNWARTPRAWMTGGLNLTVEVGSNSGEINMGVKSLSRYEIGVFWQRNETPGSSSILWMAEA